MSSSDAQHPDLATLVQQVTEAVLRQLEAVAPAAHEPGGRLLGWLLGAPTGHLPALAQEMAVLARLGHRQTVLGCPDAVTALAGQALPGRIALPDPAAPVSARLAQVAELDLLYVGALGWHQARALAALEDRDEAVAIVLEALSRGVVVRAVTGEALGGIHRFAPGTRASGRLAAEAAQLWRDLGALGVSTVGLDALGQPLASLEAGRHSWGRALGGLLTEKDVEAAAAEGRRELRLPAATVVTPLARDRARELELTIRRDD